MLLYILTKKGFFLDETASFILANGNLITFDDLIKIIKEIRTPEELQIITNKAFTMDQWINRAEVQKYYHGNGQNMGSYLSVYLQQAIDVHPPLYYLFIHTFSYAFAGLNLKWLGFLVNIIFLISACFLVYRIFYIMPLFIINLIVLRKKNRAVIDYLKYNIITGVLYFFLWPFSVSQIIFSSTGNTLIGNLGIKGIVAFCIFTYIFSAVRIQPYYLYNDETRAQYISDYIQLNAVIIEPEDNTLRSEIELNFDHPMFFETRENGAVEKIVDASVVNEPEILYISKHCDINKINSELASNNVECDPVDFETDFFVIYKIRKSN